MKNSNEHFARLRQMVALEQKADQEAFQQSLQRRGATFASSICEPSCRYPIRLGQDNRSPMGQLQIELHYDVSEEEIELDFEPGKPVVIFYLKGPSDLDGYTTWPHQSYVEQVSDGRLTISLPSVQALQSLHSLAQHHLIGIQVGVDNTSYRVMTEALHQAEHSDDERFTKIKEVLLGNRRPQQRQLPPLSFPWLNDSQNAAIRKVVEAQEVAIIHGPPGTGKTTTLVEAIIETLQRETQVLVCAPSNAAVDWISEQLMRRSVEVLRIGNPLRISDQMLDCCYERRYAAHPDYHELWNMRRALNSPNTSVERKHRLRERITQLEIKINADLFEHARVVSCTLIGSALRLMDRRHFSTLFIDEAAQALEPACWAAILKADRVVMSGDHQQLPPTIKCLEAARGGLATTLMQRLVGQWPQCVSLLTTQYRMNESIMDFPSKWFYHSQLHAAPEVAHRLVSPLDTPLTWIDTSALNFQEKANAQSSLSNIQEARLVISTLRDYIEMLSPAKIESERIDFGIITPYRGQARLIRRLLKMQHYFRRLRHNITVGTVDGFQGQERDVVVISLVRDNENGQIGFLRDLRRMNVAITRARMKLIIVGNASTLAHHRFYHALIDHIEHHGQLIQIPPLSDTEQT